MQAKTSRVLRVAGITGMDARLGVSLSLALFFCVLFFPCGCGGRGGGNNSKRNGPEAKGLSSSIVSGKQVCVRVLLQQRDRFRVSGRNGGCVFRLGQAGREVLRLPAAVPCIVLRRAGRWEITDEAGRDLLAANAAGTGDAGGRFLDGNGLTGSGSDNKDQVLEIRPVNPVNGSVLCLGDAQGQCYRGWIRCQAQRGGANRATGGRQQNSAENFSVINIVEIEQYLDGVVGCEMYSRWPIAALRSQSIAARSYVLYQMERRVNRDWDVACTQASQVYGGLARENRRVREAVSSTRGVVLAYGNKGSKKLFPTFFSAICGGHTADGGVVFGVNIAPLNGHKCEYCSKVAPAKYYSWGPVVIGKQCVSDLLIKRYPLLAGLEKITDIKIQKKSNYGRVELLKLTGINGKVYNLSAEKFRLAISQPDKPLFSSWYRLVDDGDNWRFEDGHGWGHGVGMCQYGALGMAEAGKSCIAILTYYYPRAVLVRAY